ncbi:MULTISPECIES: alpha/beta fold hydrolase [unclassified Brevundimonas]|uniref:alpha/beta fold hydrolase n=1 Tax=unclassified Brevundimonas TaxID=2622653 RepID=UPI0025BE1CB8|nr:MULTISPECIES: alpha/beta fold hydrolase [unclassified Brevundimonas]
MTTPLVCGRRTYVNGLWGQVHIREWGEGPPLVLLHQTPWNGIQFHKLAPLLAAAGWRVIAPDTPGYGLSEPSPSPPDIEDYAANLEVTLHALGIDRAIIGGHHTGALIASAFAALSPAMVRGLVLHNPPLYSASEREQRQSMPHRAFAPVEGGSHFVDRWAFMRDFADPNLSVENLHLANLAYYLNDIRADHGHSAAYRFDLAALLPLVSAPALLLSSRLDPVSGHAERFQNLHPHWNLVHLDGGSANILEQPEIWSEVCLSYLKTLPA